MTSSSTQDALDRQLLRRVADRDREAFRRLYDRYYRRLFNYVFSVIRRPEMVEEVVDDVLIAVWRGAESFAGRSRVSTWIFGIAYRQAMKALRRRSPELDTLESEPRDRERGPEGLMMRRELSSILGRALDRLSPEQRAVVELTYFEGCSYPEIAEIVDCPVNTVKTRMFYARRKLREILPELGIDDPSGSREVEG